MPDEPKVDLDGRDVKGTLSPPKQAGGPPTYKVQASKAGVHPYTLTVGAGKFVRKITGTLTSVTWDATFFRWTKEVDPREDLDGWRKLARGDTAVSVKAKQLTFKYGGGGPSQQNLSEELKAANLGGDYFGMIAKTRLPLPEGKWELTTTSDDGVRVTVDGKPVIDNWTWHPPHRDTGTFELDKDRTIEIVVEHFEIDGYAVMELQIMRTQ
jgi:hypothetical protein